MRFTNSLDYIIKDNFEIRILRFLVLNKSRFSGREIARKTNISAPQCHKKLKQLANEGLVEYEEIGNSMAYSINNGNYLVEVLFEPLFKKERHLIRLVAHEFVKKIKAPVLSVILFGSLARGKEKPESDIDWLIIVKDEETLNKVKEEINSAEKQITLVTGNDVSSFLMTAKQFRNRYIHESWPPIKDIKKHGEFIYGKSLSEVLKIGSKAGKDSVGK